jgi:pimeloyl-ACP methyl ester carboxylesterase
MIDITLLNGEVKLAGSVHGRTEAQPILFLHGLTQSRDTWNEIAQRLQGHYCVWTLDFRGHGDSDLGLRWPFLSLDSRPSETL